MELLHEREMPAYIILSHRVEMVHSVNFSSPHLFVLYVSFKLLLLTFLRIYLPAPKLGGKDSICNVEDSKFMLSSPPETLL
jgi:hypothetical protein